MENNENMKKELEQELEKKKLEQKAHMMLLDLLTEIMPNEHRPLFELPKLCNAVANKVGKLMLIVKDLESLDKGTEYAQRACAFLAQMNESIEAFIERETPSESQSSSDFDLM